MTSPPLLPPRWRTFLGWAVPLLAAPLVFFQGSALSSLPVLLLLLLLSRFLPASWRTGVGRLALACLAIPLFLGVLWIGGFLVEERLPNPWRVDSVACPATLEPLPQVRLVARDSGRIAFPFKAVDRVDLRLDTAQCDTLVPTGRWRTRRPTGFARQRLELEVLRHGKPGWLDPSWYRSYRQEVPLAAAPYAVCLETVLRREPSLRRAL